MVHYSKKDWLLVGAAFAAAVVPFTFGALFTLTGTTTSQLGLALITIGAGTGVVLLLLTYPLYYRITSSELIVRCGILMRRQIPLASINEVEPDKSPLGAPTWSLDRLRVNYRKNGRPAYILISPADKSAFMQDLARTDSNLKMKGNRLMNRESQAGT
jgi:hypothetical protein